MKEVMHFIFDWQGVLEIFGKPNKEILDWIDKNHISASVLSNCSNIDADLFVTISHPGNLHFLKPHKGAFLLHLQRISYKPKEIVFVDDNPINLDSAAELGLNVLLYKDNKSFFQTIKNEFNFDTNFGA